MEQFDTLPIQCRHIEHMHEGVWFRKNICLACMNMFARFDENPAMTLQVIKETKRYGRTDGCTDGRMHGRTDARTT